LSYRVEITEVAEAKAEQAWFWLIGVSPETAGIWYDGLLEAFEGLADMPHRFPEVQGFEQSAARVRMLLYGRRANMYRVLFRVIEEPRDDGTDGIVRVLHVTHGARPFP